MIIDSAIVPLLLPSLFVGVLIACSSGTLGCFVIWRKMAFFSDALAHSAVLGTALALITDINILYGLLGYGAVVAILMARFDTTLHYSGDTLLAIIAQVSLAAGLLLLPFASTSINIESLLFGDILAINWLNVLIASGITLCITTAIIYFWRPLLDLCINEELAATEGIPVQRLKLLLFLLLVALIAIAVQLVGVLLISALLLIPAATARKLARTPEQMVILSPLIGCLAVIAGLFFAYQMNSAAGPTIVVSAATIWLSSFLKESSV